MDRRVLGNLLAFLGFVPQDQDDLVLNVEAFVIVVAMRALRGETVAGEDHRA